jgi:hypothetical protein
MCKFDFFLVSLFVIFMVLGSHTVSFARDEGGCLTCHQYPGLVRLDKNSGQKILHIDEAKYTRSPHGKLTCEQCHTTISKIPHTGETKVECNSQCHLTKKDKHMLKTYDYSILHKKEQSYIRKMKDPTSCRVCHPLYPHGEDEHVRALLNMHTGFMYCEACHIKRDMFGTLTYDWSSSDDVDFVGDYYGTRFYPQAADTNKLEHYLARITVLNLVNGEKISRINTWDTRRAKEYQQKESFLSLAEKKDQMVYFHKDIAKKGISVACEECHSENSILDFKELGFSELKSRELININLKGLVSKYETFFLPQMFHP